MWLFVEIENPLLELFIVYHVHKECKNKVKSPHFMHVNINTQKYL